MFRINRLCAALTALLCTAPAVVSAHDHHDIPHYRLVDVGTLGGPNSQYSNPASRIVNRRGTAVGYSDTAVPDPFAPNCFSDCLVNHAFVSQDGVTTDLGALPGGASSVPAWINDRGQIVGESQNGLIDASTGFPQAHAVLWQGGTIRDLGTFGGAQSVVFSINKHGQIAGAGLTTAADPFANVPQAACRWLPTFGPGCNGTDFAFNAIFAPATTQLHAALWADGALHDLGTLGGPDSTAVFINNRGQIAGWSYTSFTANASGVPTVDPFLWEDGVMTDLGSLGGSMGAPSFINRHGQVVGVSNLADDTTMHPFLWGRRTGMHDLGTLGGTYAHPDWVNDASDVVGYSTTAKDAAGHRKGRAFYWHRGSMTNLGTLGTDDASEALSINNHGQIVGQTFVRGGPDLRGFLSDNGGPLIDLNTRVLPASTISVIAAFDINDRGVIAGRGLMPNGDLHALVLIPLDADQGDDGDDNDD